MPKSTRGKGEGALFKDARGYSTAKEPTMSDMTFKSCAEAEWALEQFIRVVDELPASPGTAAVLKGVLDRIEKQRAALCDGTSRTE